MVQAKTPPAPVPVTNAACPRCLETVFWSRERDLHCLTPGCSGPAGTALPLAFPLDDGIRAQVVPLLRSAAETLEHVRTLLAGSKAGQNLAGLIDAVNERAQRIVSDPESLAPVQHPPEV